jgi:hypothetical protein
LNNFLKIGLSYTSNNLDYTQEEYSGDPSNSSGIDLEVDSKNQVYGFGLTLVYNGFSAGGFYSSIASNEKSKGTFTQGALPPQDLSSDTTYTHSHYGAGLAFQSGKAKSDGSLRIEVGHNVLKLEPQFLATSYAYEF